MVVTISIERKDNKKPKVVYNDYGELIEGNIINWLLGFDVGRLPNFEICLKDGDDITHIITFDCTIFEVFRFIKAFYIAHNHLFINLGGVLRTINEFKEYYTILGDNINFNNYEVF